MASPSSSDAAAVFLEDLGGVLERERVEELEELEELELFSSCLD
jgi:hypothetical protein